MNTNTLEMRALRVADFLASLTQPLNVVRGLLTPAAPTVDEASAQLLRLADAYEETQPSYAADLRAAATAATRH